MQIEVVDDQSTRDDPERVVAAVGRGRVGFHRQPVNVGHVTNFNACLRRSHGLLVHVLHGDDVVLPGFYRTLGEAFEAADIGAAFCRYVAADADGHWQSLGPLVRPESGILDGWLERLASGQLLQASSMVVRRDVYERLGGFDARIATYAEDWEMWVRIAAHCSVWFETRPLAVYRVHGGSLSGDPARLRQNMRDLRTAMRIVGTYLPAGRRATIERTARRSTALALVRRARRRLPEGDLDFPWASLSEALAFSRSPAVAGAIALLVARWGVGWLTRAATAASTRTREG
jgi:hypothetical protein